MKATVPRRRAARALLQAAACVLIAGCASQGALEHPPRITLVDLAPIQVQVLEQRYLATVRIQNPNPVALPISGLSYTISINGADFAHGVSNQQITIPAFGEKTLDLGVTSTIVKLFEQLQRFGDAGGRVQYGITGSLGLQGQITTVPFAQHGEIDLRLDRPLPGRAA